MVPVIVLRLRLACSRSMPMTKSAWPARHYVSNAPVPELFPELARRTLSQAADTSDCVRIPALSVPSGLAMVTVVSDADDYDAVLPLSAVRSVIIAESAPAPSAAATAGIAAIVAAAAGPAPLPQVCNVQQDPDRQDYIHPISGHLHVETIFLEGHPR